MNSPCKSYCAALNPGATQCIIAVDRTRTQTHTHRLDGGDTADEEVDGPLVVRPCDPQKDTVQWPPPIRAKRKVLSSTTAWKLPRHQLSSSEANPSTPPPSPVSLSSGSQREEAGEGRRENRTHRCTSIICSPLPQAQDNQYYEPQQVILSQ